MNPKYEIMSSISTAIAIKQSRPNIVPFFILLFHQGLSIFSSFSVMTTIAKNVHGTMRRHQLQSQRERFPEYHIVLGL
jgi:hypothetical protein